MHSVEVSDELREVVGPDNCPVCGRAIKLESDKTLVKHRLRPKGWPNEVCEMSGVKVLRIEVDPTDEENVALRASEERTIEAEDAMAAQEAEARSHVRVEGS